MNRQPDIKVGILSLTQIEVELLAPYIVNGSTQLTGKQTFTLSATKKVVWNGNEYDNLMFIPENNDGTFEVKDVVIGVNFHWERRENQRFEGSLSIIVEGDKLTLINQLPVESYLQSVISSEMSATASSELLKAHAVISRSWLLAQIDKNKKIEADGTKYSAIAVDNDEEYIRWYDREDHINFDVCADDHCQRYQGITRQTTPKAKDAVMQTAGEVLMSEGELCDARFSKCCGGVYEEFENCWEPKHYSYLEARRDGVNETDIPDLRNEENARQWILSRPEAFCDVVDAHILSQVMNNYDCETTDFYRWKVEYTQDELSQLIRNRSGIDFGEIIDLQPVERGTSGRLVKLRIVGTKRTLVIGKELEIRRTLSTSHLYSSAFIVERLDVDAQGMPAKFVLKGAGWGHGVGLCQIGAAVMGEKGYDYRAILTHYFPGADITTIY